MLLMSHLLREVSTADRKALGHEVAEVFHAAPPGADRIKFVRELLARHDARQTSYADRIILDACSRLDVLRATCELLHSQRGRA